MLVTRAGATILLFWLAVPALRAESLIIMGWDGAGLLNINRLLGEGKLPNLQGLLDDGASLVPLESIGRTETGTAWTHAFTGLTYDQTGVLGLRNYDDYFGGELDRGYNELTGLYNGMQFWYESIPFEHTIFHHLRERPARIGWLVSKRLLYQDDPDFPERPAAIFKLVTQAAQSRLLAMPNELGDAYLDVLGDKALQFLDTFGNQTYVLFLHTDPDFYGHSFGENSPEYEAEFIRSDDWLGLIRDRVGTSSTRILVMADHGFNEGVNGHPNAGDAWMVTDIPIDPAYAQQPGQKAFGTLRDVAPTILEHFGFDWRLFHPPIRGKSLRTSSAPPGRAQ